MITRRRLMRNLSCVAAASQLASESLFARRLRADWAGEDARSTHEDLIWLDSNENPAGPPPSAIKAMAEGAAATARYHFDEFDGFAAAIAQSEGLKPENVLFGVGSTEIIDAAICAFTSSTTPLITATSTYDILIELTHTLGRNVVQVPLTSAWGYDVRKLAAEAVKAGGGLIYLCNPNNPTSSITPKEDIEWLAANLPPRTVLLVDEAYIHFADPEKVESARKFAGENKNVIVTRTFSKVYGMAGARAGFGCAKPSIIKALNPFVDKVIPILALRGAMAALAERETLVPSRRADVARIRGELCDWLRAQNIRYIDPHANFVMIDIGRDARSFGKEMRRHGVVVGRPFPPLNQMLRITIGTDLEMKRFRDVFAQVYASPLETKSAA
jgi:histidinol-phosphate aminotransferase